MSFASPANRIARWSVVGMEGMWAKMFDPPTTSPATADLVPLVAQNQGRIRPNPVPEIMFAAGFQDKVSIPNTVQRDLMHNLSVPTWDGQHIMAFYVIGDPDNPTAASGSYPGPTLRMPRGVIFQAETQGKGPPPHTIHWHGIEPTPLNDGVGHCSMEIGKYFYQWQPNFMGFYFAHCHRNTVQHFEFGLYHAMIFEAPDAYFGSIASTNPDGTVVLRDPNQFPIGCGRDGRRRVACNLGDPLNNNSLVFPQFPGFNSRPIDSPDDQPLAPTDTPIRFPTDPHAMTVPFDVESLLVFDDRDSEWSNLGADPRATFPAHGPRPGFDDNFARNPGAGGFAAFNDYNADYWFVTGVPVAAPRGGTFTLGDNIVIPPALNSGITGTQVSINAKTGDTILVRCLDAAYNSLRLTFPVDVVIIAWDGRALGVGPYGHNHSFQVPKNTPIDITVARRFDALIRETTPFTGTIKAEFIDHTSQTPVDDTEQIVMTVHVPLNIGGTPVDPPTFAFIGKVVDQLGAPVAGATVTCSPISLTGAPLQTVTTAADGSYTITGRTNGTYDIVAAKVGKLAITPKLVKNCNNANITVENIVVSVAEFLPGSYQISDALSALRSSVGLTNPTALDKLRYDVAPLPIPDTFIDIRDALNLLRMSVGLAPV